MSEGSEDDSSKTEEPSQKKLDDAKKKGQFAQSREISHFFMFFALTMLIMVLSPGIGRDVVAMLSPLIHRPDFYTVDSRNLGELLRDILSGVLIIMIVPIVLAFAAVFAPSAVQKKWAFTAEQVKPKFEKISPLKGIARIYSIKSLIEFLKNIIKISIIALIVYYCAKPYFGYVDALADQSSLATLKLIQLIAGKIMIAVCILLFLLSIGDFMLQRFMFLKSMRMTKQEVKEEYKQQEGDPHIRAKLKQIRRDKARKRMMANVPKADVVITNPTHYAVALQYDSDTMAAPTVVAKGADVVAARIRELAGTHKIPIIRNPTLDSILYDTTYIYEIIPPEHFQAVAKIIGYVYRLKGKAPKEMQVAKQKAAKKATTLFRKTPTG